MLRRILPVCCLAMAALLVSGCYCGRPYLYDGVAGYEGGMMDDCCGAPAGCAGGACGARVARAPARVAHGSSCGCADDYWGDWMTGPGACGDSCNSCGEWDGCGGCWPFPILNGLRRLWGYPYHPGFYGEGYGYGYGYEYGAPYATMEGPMMEGEVLESQPEVKVPAKPTPAPEPAANKQAAMKRAAKYAKYQAPVGRYVKRTPPTTTTP